MRVEQGIQPVPFEEDHPYSVDPVLPSLLTRLLPGDCFEDVDKDLKRFGAEVIPAMRTLCTQAEPPKLVQYNQWGQRIDDLQTSEGWRGLKSTMQREGIIGIFYERKYREYSRLYGFTKLLLCNGDSQVIDCPLSMTDGCARVIETIGNESVKREIFPRLISRDPAVAFTAGQWMTERGGGSDVSRTETIATAVPESSESPYGPKYKLDGFKWFSSATDSDVALALARTGRPEDGSRGLSLFLIPLRRPLFRSPTEARPSATSNNIFVHRLKNKFGTQIVPTAELSLEGAEAYLIGQPGQGVKHIAQVLNITRLHCAVMSAGSLRKCLSVATAYARVRRIQGGTVPLMDVPLHVAELAKINLSYRALVHLVLGAVALLGKSECGVADAGEELRLRLLTPVVKAFAADKACAAMQECMTALGGEGYMEENGLGRSLRDGMVEKIWEGTVTVLSLDVVRAISKSNALDAFLEWAESITRSCPDSLRKTLHQPLYSLQTALSCLKSAYTAPMSPFVPRPALILFGHVASSLYLLEHAVWANMHKQTSQDCDVEVFRRWTEEGEFHAAVEGVQRAKEASADKARMDLLLVYGHAATEEDDSDGRTVRARL